MSQIPLAGRTLLLLALGLMPGAAHAQDLLRELRSPNEEESGFFGYSVSGVDDVDGDGRGDVLIGAYYEGDGIAFGGPGRAYVFSGATGALLHTLDSLTPKRKGNFGFAVAGVPDVDGDGLDDLLVGAPVEGQNGQAHVFSGASGTPLYTLEPPEEEPGLLAGADLFGRSVSGIADVDGDGRGDLLVGEFQIRDGGNTLGPGRAYAFSGATGALLYTLESPNAQIGGAFGESVAGVPDVDGDAVADLLIGAYGEDPGASPLAAGRAYVYSGATGALLHEVRSPNEEQGGYFGDAIAGVADVDGDGRGDLLVGAKWEGNGGGVHGPGRAYLFSGASGGLLHTLESPNEDETGEFGFSVSGVGDVDGGGISDLLIGAPGEDPGLSPTSAGRAYVYSGITGELLHEVQSPNEEEGGLFGISVSAVGDVDGDGRGDLLVGANEEDPGASSFGAGRAYVFSGGVGGALAVSAEPVSGPLVIPAGGGTFTYTVTTTNTTAATQTFELWTRVTKPNGQQTPVLRGPITRMLAPGASVTDDLTQSIPGGIPAGAYIYTAYVGTYPDDVLASDAFVFTKQGAALAGREGADGEALWEAAAAPPAQASPSGALLAAFSASPNPFSERTALSFALDASAEVRLSVFDALGREVAVLVDGRLAAGSHAVTFDGSPLPVGVYVWRLVTGARAETGRLTLLR